MSKYYKILKLFELINLDKPLRECYKHSIHREIKYVINKKIKPEALIEQNIENFKILINNQSPGLEKDLYIQQIREEESVSILKNELGPEMTFVDIGANIGYYTLYSADILGSKGEIIAFEPANRTYKRLKENLSMNNFSNISTFEKAIGHKDSEIDFLEKDSANLSRITFNSKSSSTTVKMMRLDSFLNDKSIDMIRMDVQGFEYFILKGMKDILSSQDVKLFIEVHPKLMQKNYDICINEFWKLLSEYDYKIKTAIAHPPKPDVKSFFYSRHPPRKIYDIDMPISSVIGNDEPAIFNKNSYRVFLEK